MGPLGHAAISGVVGGGVWMATGSKGAAALAVGVGVLMDLDHVYDFYQWYVKGRRDRVYVVLHAWEFSAAGLGLLATAIYHPFLWATVLAHLAHVCTDQLSNDVSRFGYSIIYRLIKRFDITLIAPHLDAGTEYRRLHQHLPFSRYWESWFERRIYPWLDQRLNRPGDSEGVDSRGAAIGPRRTGEER